MLHLWHKDASEKQIAQDLQVTSFHAHRLLFIQPVYFLSVDSRIREEKQGKVPATGHTTSLCKEIERVSIHHPVLHFLIQAFEHQKCSFGWSDFVKDGCIIFGACGWL